MSAKGVNDREAQDVGLLSDDFVAIAAKYADFKNSGGDPADLAADEHDLWDDMLAAWNRIMALLGEETTDESIFTPDS